ncbi:hypothetical protein [Sandaracinus amylolyticus]|uniref:hypothetical protein n=1 Tax=Sandaracinus amylolyticus TaxID=927083 RepID=UPI001F2959F7|nr:hypothetical protein [Sandaracinus amylolyticus]UJR82740.1 Hypothetical protein I5071_48050 [Sandaracinus amylolyticus]
MANEAWKLESFVDSLVVELDKTRETLAVKSINKPLTYTVKDVALELQIFPTYDGDAVEFRTAQPGQAGASKLSIQLASITDQQVRATSKGPPKKGDVEIDAVPIDPATKKKLRRLGVTSVEDLEQIEKRDVDLQKVGEGGLDYKNLANLIQRARRGSTPPRVSQASLERDADGRRVLRIEGQNLAISASHVPVAVFNAKLGEVRAHDARRLTIELGDDVEVRPDNELILTLDPYCIVRMQVREGAVRSR